MVKSPVVVLSQFPSELNEETNNLKSISLLPFTIGFDGLAPISTYFINRIRTSTSKSLTKDETLSVLEGSFRGRQVLSTPIDLPLGFKGLVFSTTTPTISNTSVEQDSKPKANKKVKLNSNEEFVVEGKGKGKEIILPSIAGRRTSPRKKVAVIKYAMDSDDDEAEEEDEMLTKEVEIAKMKEEEIVSMEVEQFQIEITAPSSPIAPTVSLSISSKRTLSVEDSSSSILSTTDTPVESQSSATTLDEDEKVKDLQELIPSATFNSIQIYNADYELDVEEDVFVKTINEWVGLSNKIHNY